MSGFVLGPRFDLLVVARASQGDVLSVVLVAAWWSVAGVFAICAAVLLRQHLRRPSPGRTTGEAAPGLGLPVLRPLGSADAGGTPTSLTSAGPTWRWDAA